MGPFDDALHYTNFSSHLGPDVALFSDAFISVRIERLAAVTTKITVFWDVAPYCLAEFSRRFGGTCSLPPSSGLLFYPENEDCTFLRNIAEYLKLRYMIYSYIH
jgi:hypothetical protein